MKTGMIQLGVLVLTTFMGLAQAQEMNQPMSFMGTGGGNGGDPIELKVTSVIWEIHNFFLMPENQAEFPEVNFSEFLPRIESVYAVVSDETIIDAYGVERCMVNQENIITINRDCWNQSLASSPDVYPMVFHELLGVEGLETAGQYISSVYPISSRLSQFVKKTFDYRLENFKTKEKPANVFVKCFKQERGIKREQIITAQIELNEKGFEVSSIRKTEKLKGVLKHLGYYISGLWNFGKQRMGIYLKDEYYKYKYLNERFERKGLNVEHGPLISPYFANVYHKENYKLTLAYEDGHYLNISFSDLILNNDHDRDVYSVAQSYRGRTKRSSDGNFLCWFGKNETADLYKENGRARTRRLTTEENEFVRQYFLNF